MNDGIWGKTRLYQSFFVGLHVKFVTCESKIRRCGGRVSVPETEVENHESNPYNDCDNQEEEKNCEVHFTTTVMEWHYCVLFHETQNDESNVSNY